MGLWVVAAMFAAGGFYYFFQNVAAGVRPSTRLVVLWATLIPSFIIFLVGAVRILLRRRGLGGRQTTGRTAGRRCASRAYSAARRPPSAGGSIGSSGCSAPASPSGVQMISGDFSFAAARRSALSRATALSRPKDSPRSACIDL